MEYCSNEYYQEEHFCKLGVFWENMQIVRIWKAKVIIVFCKYRKEFLWKTTITSGKRYYVFYKN